MNFNEMMKNLDAIERNEAGKKWLHVTLSDGTKITAVSSIAGSHQSASSWGRLDFKINGKKATKSKVVELLGNGNCG